MLSKIDERTLALAGIFQNCSAVQNLAQKGMIEQAILDTAVKSIFATDPDSTEEVFGNISELKSGLKIIENQLDRSNNHNKNKRNKDLTRYSITVLFLASKLLKDKKKLETMSAGIDRAKNQSEHFGLDHSNVYASLGGLYTETISLINPRIMVSGEPEYLNNPENANRIRTLLLGAIRCAVLWKQMGGSRWQLVFKRKQIASSVRTLLEKVN